MGRSRDAADRWEDECGAGERTQGRERPRRSDEPRGSGCCSSTVCRWLRCAAPTSVHSRSGCPDRNTTVPKKIGISTTRVERSQCAGRNRSAGLSNSATPCLSRTEPLRGNGRCATPVAGCLASRGCRGDAGAQRRGGAPDRHDTLANFILRRCRLLCLRVRVELLAPPPRPRAPARRARHQRGRRPRYRCQTRTERPKPEQAVSGRAPTSEGTQRRALTCRERVAPDRLQ